MACEQCDGLRKEIEDLVADRNARIEDNRNRLGRRDRERPDRVIVALARKIAQKREELRKCLIACGAPMPLVTGWSGFATLTTSLAAASGPFNNTISGTLRFSKERTQVILESFAEIVAGPFSPLPGVTIITTIKRVGGGVGVFEAATGALSMPLELIFDNDVWFAEDSFLTLNMTTGRAGGLQGVPLNRVTRTMTLVGSGPFRGGALDGSTGNLTLALTLAQLP